MQRAGVHCLAGTIDLERDSSQEAAHMDNNEMEQRIRSIYESGDLEALARALDEMVADDVVQEWPQSGERIRGRDNIKAINDNYPQSTGTTPKSALRRIMAPGKAWVIESVIDYGDGVPVSMVSIIETNTDGKIARTTDYFASPFPAPEWRKQWVEQTEPMKVG
jgi:SnoaL-like protein